MWDRKKYVFFFCFGQGPHFLRMRYVAQRESSRHRSEFFLWILISSLSVSYTLPWFMIPFIPTLISPPNFFLTETHTRKKTPHNVRKRLIRAAAPPSSLFWLCHVCVCVNVCARAQRHLFFLPLKIFGRPVICMNVFQFDYKKEITHKTLPTTTTKTHTKITTTPPPPWSVQPLSPFIYWREIFELKEEEEKFLSVPCLFL